MTLWLNLDQTIWHGRPQSNVFINVTVTLEAVELMNESAVRCGASHTLAILALQESWDCGSVPRAKQAPRLVHMQFSQVPEVARGTQSMLNKKQKEEK